MREFESKQKFKHRMYSFPALAILLIITGALVKGSYSLIVKEREGASEVKKLALEIEALRVRENELEVENKRLNTTEGVEEEIKSKFNVARAGEQVAVIVDRLGRVGTTTPPKKAWYKRIWDAIIR